MHLPAVSLEALGFAMACHPWVAGGLRDRKPSSSQPIQAALFLLGRQQPSHGWVVQDQLPVRTRGPRLLDCQSDWTQGMHAVAGSYRTSSQPGHEATGSKASASPSHCTSR